MEVIHAQDIRNDSNMLIDKFESDGTVRDRSNMMVGRFKSDGTVVNRNNMGAVQFFRGCLPCDNYPKIVHRRYMKNGTSATPCTCALKPLIFEFRDSAEAFECLSLK